MTIGFESNCSLLTDPHNQEKISDDHVDSVGDDDSDSDDDSDYDDDSDDDNDVDHHNERTTALDTPIEGGTLVQG